MVLVNEYTLSRKEAISRKIDGVFILETSATLHSTQHIKQATWDSIWQSICLKCKIFVGTVADCMDSKVIYVTIKT